MAAPRRRLELVPRSGDPRVRALDEVVRVPARSPITNDLKRGLAAAAALHRIATDLAPVPVRPTGTTTDAGFRVVRYGAAGMEEVGHFIDQGGNDFWGVQLTTNRRGQNLVLASARDSGLYIFHYTGPR